MLILGLVGGCALREAYNVAEDDDLSPAPQGIPDYRMPSPPQYTPPAQLTSARASEPQASPRMLKDLETRAEGNKSYKFVLDERQKRYHRVNCPYAPRNEQGYDLQVEGNKLVARPVLEQTGTHMSKAEIEARGYKPCQHCRPDLGKPPPWFGGPTETHPVGPDLPHDGQPASQR